MITTGMRALLLVLTAVAVGGLISSVRASASASSGSGGGRTVLASVTVSFPSDPSEIRMFQLRAGEDLIQNTKYTCFMYHVDELDCFQITLMMLDLIRTRYQIPLRLHVYIADSLKELIIRVEDNLAEALDWVCAVSGMQATLAERCPLAVVEQLWPAVETRIAATYEAEISRITTRGIVDNENVLFVVRATLLPTRGIGNILKGYITSLSIHPNSKIAAGSNLMTNYNNILESDHILAAGDEDVAEGVEEINTWRWHILKTEGQLIPPDSPYRHPESDDFRGFMPNPHLVNLFDNNVTIDLTFSTDLLPTSVNDRIYRGMSRLRFQRHILEAAEAVVSLMRGPTLGLSVRSWGALHEKAVDRRYDRDEYRRCIQMVVEKYNIKSVLVAVDNPGVLLNEYIDFIKSLDNRISVHSVEHINVDPLVKGAVELLALSKSSVLIGDKLSTFLELAFWLNECRSTVIHPY